MHQREEFLIYDLILDMVSDETLFLHIKSSCDKLGYISLYTSIQVLRFYAGSCPLGLIQQLLSNSMRMLRVIGNW